VWGLEVSAQPQTKSAKLCKDGAVKSSGNNIITNIPNDAARNVSTAMSSNTRVRTVRGRSYRK
jgi:hypothetical protein